MQIAPFGSGKVFYRGNLHGHSTHSDGLLSPEEVKAFYRNEGYDFICLSDHLWKDTSYAATSILDASDLDEDDFITIPSAELHCYGKSYDSDGLWHIVANGLPLDFAVAHDDETAPQVIDRALAAGAYVTLAHPEWYSMTTKEALSVSHAHGVEIYNHSCVIGSNRGSGILIADFLLQEGKHISFTATDDSHFSTPDAGGGWVMVAADDLSAESIISALKQGHHYSSTGAAIYDMTIDDDILRVTSSPAISVVLSGQGHRAASQQGSKAAPITEAKFDLSLLKADWFRITIRGVDGTMAWSNPIWR